MFLRLVIWGSSWGRGFRFHYWAGQFLGEGMSMEGLLAKGNLSEVKVTPETRGEKLRCFGYQQESLELLLRPMCTDGEEALGSMGNDAPLAVLSAHPRMVFDYFYQLFAQVTNPPIDPIRESVVMSIACWVGPNTNILAEPTADHCKRLWLESPCLLPEDFAALSKTSDLQGWKSTTIDTTFPKAEGTPGLEVCTMIRMMIMMMMMIIL